MEDEKPKLSFSILQRKKNPLTCLKRDSEFEKNEKESIKEFITAVEDNVFNFSNPKQEENFIIPLKRSKSSLINRLNAKNFTAGPIDDLTRQALDEINQETKQFTNEQSSFTALDTVSIPQNDVSQDAEAEDANYDAIPIEKFGVALLAGMGFDPKQLKDSKEEVHLPQRPKGLGLGANPGAVQAAAFQSSQFKTKELTWKTGAYCQVIFGKCNGCYGVLQGLDGDTGRVIVKLTISKEIIPILQHYVRLVCDKEYHLYANCLNQKEVDEYKAKEAKQQNLDNLRYRQKSPQSPDSSPHHKTSYRKVSMDSNKIKDSPQIKCEPKRSSSDLSWIRPKLIVQCLDRNLHGGHYYRQKLTIVSVNSDRCCCKTDSGRLIEDVPTRYLQTYIPHELNSVLMVVDGNRAGQITRLIKRDGLNKEVDVKTRSGVALRYHFDSICAISDPFSNK